MRINIIVSIFLIALSGWSQNVTLSGNISDEKTGESVSGAMISLVSQKVTGTVSNAYGFYSLTMPAGTYTLRVKYIGYAEIAKEIMLTSSQKLDIAMSKKETQIKEVVISSKKKIQDVSTPQMGKVTLDMAEIAKVPVLFGEKDVLKTIQLLPGVMPAQEGNSGFVVRGGNPDQNLILLDEAPVYNSSHVLGFFSTFNTDALKDMTLFKGNMPAEYGGRLASVVDVKMKEGNNKNYVVGGGVGIIAARLFAEGPIEKDKASFFVSGRRTYADAFLALAKDSVAKQSTLYFYDFNVKLNYKLGKKDKIYLSGYFGKDQFGLGNLFGIGYGNTTTTFRWNHIFNDKIFSNTSLVYNNFNYQVKINFNNLDIYVNSIINDFSLKQDLDYYLNANHHLKFGYLGTWHNVVPGDVTSSDPIFASKSLNKSNGLENAFYLQNEHAVTDQLKLNYGARLSLFTVAGPNTMYRFNSQGTVLDTQVLGSFQLGKTYINIEPRFSAAYTFTENNSVKVAYSRNVQNLHLLSNTSASRPTDRWILSTNNVRPEISDQVSAGYYFNFGNDMFEASVETYYKWMQNLIDYKNGTILRANETVEGSLLYGSGRAYGIELYIKKRLGKFTGWISYTLSRSERQFTDINNGNWYPSRYDRTHDLAIVMMYELSRKVSVSANFVFYTGNAVTYPIGKYGISATVDPNALDNTPITLASYSDRNTERFPNYNRLDLALTWKLGKSKNYEQDLNFSLYNAMGTKNPYLIDFLTDKKTNEAYIQKTYLFTFVPSITYNFKLTAGKK